MHIHKGGQLKDISEQHTWSVLGIDVPGVHYKHLGHMLNVLHDVEELHAHHRELPEDVLPAIHHEAKPYQSTIVQRHNTSRDTVTKP